MPLTTHTRHGRTRSGNPRLPHLLDRRGRKAVMTTFDVWMTGSSPRPSRWGEIGCLHDPYTTKGPLAGLGPAIHVFLGNGRSRQPRRGCPEQVRVKGTYSCVAARAIRTCIVAVAQPDRRGSSPGMTAFNRG